jgi:hypothetical protein
MGLQPLRVFACASIIGGRKSLSSPDGPKGFIWEIVTRL